MTATAHITEAQLQNTILEMARAIGYLAYHSHTSRRSEPGFPDVVLVSQPPMPPRLLFIECKAEGGRITRGRISPRSRRYLPGQRDWLLALCRCTDQRALARLKVAGFAEFMGQETYRSPVEVYIWGPSDLDDLERILAGDS